jgi:hypothetical protein
MRNLGLSATGCPDNMRYIVPILLCLPLITHAQDPLLSFTEESPTDLEVTVGGVAFGSVINTSAFNWFWAYPAPSYSIGSILTYLPAWTEPDTRPGLPEFGTVLTEDFINPTPGPNGPIFATGGVSIVSEHSFATFYDGPLSPYGSVVDSDLKFSFNGGGSATYNVEFNVVPEPPAIMLIGLAIVCVASVRWFVAVGCGELHR